MFRMIGVGDPVGKITELAAQVTGLPQPNDAAAAVDPVGGQFVTVFIDYD
jgi:hypothetical protein